MPAKEPSGAKAKKPIDEDEETKKAAQKHAQQVKKNYHNLKPKASSKKFEEALAGPVKEFEAEFKLLRLELLGKDLQDRLAGGEMKDSRERTLMQQDMRKLIESLEEVQPSWGWAMERCSAHLRQSIGAPLEAIALCKRVIERLEDSNTRPSDAKMLTTVPGVLNDKEEELGHHRLLNLDKSDDRQYLADRMRLQQLQAQVTEDASMTMSATVREDMHRLQQKIGARKERLIQLWQHGAAGKRSSVSGSGLDGAGKEDEALKLKRQLIQQEVARAKARELCSQQGQLEGISELMHSDERTNSMLRQQQQQQQMSQGTLTAQQERMHRRLAKRKDEEKQSIGTQESCKDVKASAYVSELGSEDLKLSLRVECDKLWNQVLHAHGRLQQEQNSGIEYVHHIVAHTLNHPEARWLGRWYLGETFPFAHESQFLTIVSTLLWRTLVQTTKNRIVKRWDDDPSLKLLPWCDAHTPEEKKEAMHNYLLHNRQERQFNLETEMVRPMLTPNSEDQAGWPWEEVVLACDDLDSLHRACMCVFQDQVRHAIHGIQSTMEDRVPFIRELEQNQGCHLEYTLNVSSSPENTGEHRQRTMDRSMEFVLWFLKDRITFDSELQWVLMHRVAQDLEQHFRDNPSHNQSDSPVHDVAVLGSEVGYVHAIKERMLDLAPHHEGYGSQNTQDMLVLIMKNGELDKELEDGDRYEQPTLLSIHGTNGTDEHHDASNGDAEQHRKDDARAFPLHGKGFDAVVNHHENLETRRRQKFYEKMDSFIRRGTQWAAQLKVYSQLETLYGEAHSLRQTLVCLLRAEGGGGILEEQHTAWLQNLALFMTESFELAKRLHRAHTDHSKILVRRILCALWNKQVDERRYMDDDCHPERKIEDMTQQVMLLSREIENHQKKMMQLRTLLTQDVHKVSASVPEGADGVVKGEEMEPDMLLEMYISVNSGSTETGEQLQNVDTSFVEMQRLMTNIKEELQLFKGLQDELHIVTGPSDQCVGQVCTQSYAYTHICIHICNNVYMYVYIHTYIHCTLWWVHPISVLGRSAHTHTHTHTHT